jgi:hypothetical protein
MADREDAFNQLLEHQATDGDRQRLYRARDTLNIKPTDAVWRLLMVLEYYQTMYEKIPHQIADAARNATETIRVTAEAQAKAAREETKKGLMKAVAEAVQATAKQFARAEHFKWVSAAVSIVAITGLGGRVGRESARPGPRLRGRRKQREGGVRLRDEGVDVGADARRGACIRVGEAR